MALQSPRWITCPNCGEKRDTSGRYTSPANQEHDARCWKEEHESGNCVLLASVDDQRVVRIDIDPPEKTPPPRPPGGLDFRPTLPSRVEVGDWIHTPGPFGGPDYKRRVRQIIPAAVDYATTTWILFEGYSEAYTATEDYFLLVAKHPEPETL
jgi:hypothetical protein